MKFLIVEDHTIVRAALRTLLTSVFDAEISEAATGEDALQCVACCRPDLVLLDLELPNIRGLDILRRLRSQHEAVRVLVLSMHTETSFAEGAMKLGACGYLSKNVSSEELLVALNRVIEGHRYIENELAQAIALNNVTSHRDMQDLTERDIEILRQLATGMSLAEIADTLNAGYKTIANRCSLIKARLGVTRTSELVRLAVSMGLTESGPLG
jgi:DNA-binding NarL/FixJ family response regulator